MIQFLHRQGWSNYLALCVIWALAYFLPILAMEETDIYGDHFHVFQAVIPLILIYSTLHLSDAWWKNELGMVLILQILHNLGDVVFDDAWQAYDYRQGILNILELLILIGCGLPTLIIKTYRAHRNAGVNRADVDKPDSDCRVAQSRQGISGHAR